MIRPPAHRLTVMQNAELKRVGLKTTVPRLTILAMLEDSAVRHLSAEDIYKRLLDAGQDIGLATVYRVLTQFETAGLVIRHNFEGGRSVFELNNETHHDHIVCIRCGKVFEFIDDTIEDRQRHVAKKAGFVLNHHSMHLYGLCKGMATTGKCSKK